ncbi:hypothetical protein DUT91_12535 [Phyllobacterium salinisoli]|uniref:MipA/OmpV family protein n=1 Tax=Phyllobacterium salinisoli TaxID=1899321 RepID=A0A368K570_9HYPH|nr:hypothetical protein [Phyllobacterium salinisoli]RCS23140.1 hypothetical protein DUT91_12535 [Phyllobacterium salinisoli]
MTNFHQSLIAAAFLAVLTFGSTQVVWAEPAPLIATPGKTADGGYLVRLGARLPLGWETSVGTEIGFDGKAQSPEMLGAPEAPPSALWSSVKLPPSRLAGWDGADLNLRLGTADGSGSVAMAMRRKWTVADRVTAQVNDKYSVSYSGSAARESHWEMTKAMKLSFDGSKTAFIAQTRRTDTDPHWYTSISAQQKILGDVNLVTSMNDIASGNSTRTIGANYAHKW